MRGENGVTQVIRFVIHGLTICHPAQTFTELTLASSMTLITQFRGENSCLLQEDRKKSH